VGELSFAQGTDASSLSVEVAPADAGDAREAAKSEAEVTTGADLEGLVEDVEPAKVTSVKLGKSSYTYDGKAKRPAVTVKAGDEVVPASGYTVAYANNVNAGTATVAVTGKGDYVGTLTATFMISKAKNPLVASAAKAKVGVTYSPGKGQAPPPTSRWQGHWAR
jgi:hypothetical protein